jgi:hypothetical protein
MICAKSKAGSFRKIISKKDTTNSCGNSKIVRKFSNPSQSLHTIFLVVAVEACNIVRILEYDRSVFKYLETSKNPMT